MRKGFTLIELLIVIGILAILATTVVLVLNPSEILKQSRDAQRLADLKTLKTSLDLYLTRAAAPDLNVVSVDACVAGSSGATHPWRIAAANVSPFYDALQPFQFPSPAVDPVAPADLRAINGTGWVPVDLTSIGAAPISKLPVDPNSNFNNDLTGTAVATSGSVPGQFYAYHCSGLRYEFNANMESQKYSSGATNVENKDGGTIARGWDNPYSTGPTSVSQTYADLIYEIGNDPGLDL